MKQESDTGIISHHRFFLGGVHSSSNSHSYVCSKGKRVTGAKLNKMVGRDIPNAAESTGGTDDNQSNDRSASTLKGLKDKIDQ